MQNEREYYQTEIDLIAEEYFGRENYQRIKDSGLLHDRDLRNVKIRVLFNKFMVEKINVEEACQLISKHAFFSSCGEKYFLSPGRIRNIVYMAEKMKND